MHHDIKVGTVSWISGKVNPMLTTRGGTVASHANTVSGGTAVSYP